MLITLCYNIIVKLFRFFRSLSNRFIFNLVSGLTVGLLVGVIVLAFNNPTSNPTTGGGVIGVGSGAPASSLYINSTGNVGIGTTGPLEKLYVSGDTHTYIGVNGPWSSGYYSGIRFYAGGSLNGEIRSFRSSTGLGPMYFRVDDDGTANANDAGIIDAMTIANGGNVGIGKTPGSYALDVNGNVNATAYYGSGANLTGVTVADNSITTAKLKTATGEVSSAATSVQTLPGGTYGFYPQLKTSNGSNDARMTMGWGNWDGYGGASPTTYTTVMHFYNASGGHTGYAKQLYITASGEDHWLFLLVDKTTKEIISAYSAPDHPAYGNGGDFDKLPHPFGDYDSNTQDIVLIEKDQAKAIQQEAQEKNMGVLELIDSEYKIDLGHIYDYKPIHSGQFLETKPVLIEHIPDYIQVRKFVEMTDADKQAKKALQEEKQRQYEQEKQITKQKRQDAVIKLNALGITEEDLREIIK